MPDDFTPLGDDFTPISEVAPAKEPATFWNTVKGVAADIGGKGKTPEQMPGFFSTLIEGPTSAVKQIYQHITDPPKERKSARQSLAEALNLMNLYPPVDFVNALAARTGKTARQMGASPEVAGAVNLGTGLLAPWGMSAARKIPRVGKMLEPAVAEPMTAMPKSAEIEQTLQHVADPSRSAVSRLPETAEEFGLKYKGPAVVGEGQAPGYYREALQTAKTEAAERYARPRILAEDVAVNANEVAGALRGVAKESGLSVKIAPTRAEKFAERSAQALDPIAEEQNAYQQIKNMTMPEMQAGLSNRPTLKDVYSYLLKGSQSGDARFTKGLGEVSDVVLDKNFTMTDLLGLRQRLNGARRAAQGNDALSHQFGQLKTEIDNIIEKTSPKVREALREADAWYVSEYLPAFGNKQGALRSLTQKDAGLIVDELVPKGKKFEIAEKHIKKLPEEAQRNLQGAWVDNLMREIKDPVTNEIKPGELTKAYRNYSDRTLWALLGGKKPAMDDLMKTIDKATADAMKWKVGHVVRYGAGAGAAFSTILAVKDVIEYQWTGNKRLLGFAGADMIKAGALMVFTRPQVLARVMSGKAASINALKSFVALPPDNPKFVPAAMNVMRLLQEANQELQTQGDEKDR